MKLRKLFAVPMVVAAFALTASVVGAQVAPVVALQFASNGLTSPLNANTSDSVIARLLIDTTGSNEAVRIASLPFNLITGNGALASTLTGCQVVNENNVSDPLNNNATGSLNEGMNSITLDTPIIVSANSLTTFSLRCDVASNLVSGGTYTINMNTTNVVATGVSTGLNAMVMVRGSIVIPPIVFPPVVTTPSFPVTGASGQAAQTAAMLVASLLIASLGFSYLSLKKN